MTTINIKPVTRIESHGQLTLEYDDSGKPIEAFFATPVLRGFEAFLRGTPVERLPWLTSRICGVCPVPHSINAATAIEKAIGLKISKTAKTLRELLLLSQLIDSHTLSFVMLSLPDLVTEESVTDIVGLKEKYPDIFEIGFKLHTIGRRLTAEFGGRNVHPINVRVGGMNINPLLSSEYDFRANIKEALTLSQDLLKTCINWVDKDKERVETIGNIDTYYMGLTNNGTVSFIEGDIKIVDSKGKEHSTFSADELQNHIKEIVKKYTYMKMPFIKDLGEDKGVFRVNCLARSNVNEKFGTTIADKELGKLKEAWKNPFKQSLLSHWLRLIELIYACERVEKLLSVKALDSDDTVTQGDITNGQASNCIEAPRGTLYHNYTVSDGKIENADLIVATQNNGLALNKALSQVMNYGKKNSLDDKSVIKNCEMIIRAYDPCISCSTHAQIGLKENIRK